MRFVLALLLCVGLCGPVVACDDLPPIEVVAEAAFETAVANVNVVGSELSAMGQTAARAVYSLQEGNIRIYIELGVTEEEAARLVEIGVELQELLNVAGPLFGQGDATVRYGIMLGQTADGRLAQQFEATALICKGIGLMEQAREPLATTAVLLNEAEGIINEYMDVEESDEDRSPNYPDKIDA
jgi:hypothetical protein